MRFNKESEQSTAASLAGSDASVGQREEYIERVAKLIRDASYRQKLGKSLRTRVEQHFAFAQTARQIEQLCEQLIERRRQIAVDQAAGDFRSVASDERIA